MKRRIKKTKNILHILIIFVLLLSLAALTVFGFESCKYSNTKAEYLSILPENIRNLYEKNPDTEDFVFSYMELYGTKGEVDLSEHLKSAEIPLFMQWDKRWGYMEYSGDCVAITGCGPVCLSMVAFHLTKNKDMSPDRIVEFAIENNYYSEGSGSLWTLIGEGGKKLGLNVKELPLSENVIINNLQKGNPIICVMGKGDFTTTGHFIVMTKYEDGKIWVNDPNSFENSEKGWEYDKIKSQIKNLWACSA